VTVYVFTGPTIGADEARENLEAIYLHPAAKGDVYAAAQSKPRAIGIIDGYFQNVPSVWHKEILWAMAHGVHVFGAASMGALRAAELDLFGMRGVGRIFEAYRDGKIIDDDEVAVLHGPKETNYVAISEAMVNIRYTISSALDAGIISSGTREQLTTLAKDLFFHDRTYDHILDLAINAGLPPDEIEKLGNWLSNNKLDIKKIDSIMMLQEIASFLATDPGPNEVSFALENTETWMLEQ